MKHKNLKLLLIMLMGLAGLSVSAEETTRNGMHFTSNEKHEWTLTHCETTYNGALEIPSSISANNYVSYPVRHIAANAFKDCMGLTSVYIPGSVGTIGNGAFDGCTGLISVNFQGDATFSGNIFPNCSNLSTITVDNSNLYDSRDNCNAIIRTSTNTLVLGCKSTTIPNTVTAIGELSFYGCTGLTSFEIPNTVTAIGELSFYGCTGLTSIEIPSNVTTIASNAFRGSGLVSATLHCPTVGTWLNGVSTLETVVIGETVASVDNMAFSNCTSLITITVDEDNTTYDSRDNCNAVIETATNTLIRGCKGTTIPNSVTSIGSSAFSNSGLISISIPASVTNIHGWAFWNCKGLSNVTIDAGNSTYDSRDNCNAIIEKATDVLLIGFNVSTIPNTVKSIAADAFEYCTGLTGVTIPNSVVSISTGAFSGCI